MSLQGVDITLNIQNNRDYAQQINVMGNPSNLLDTANATREFRWDVSAFSFTNENSVTVQYKQNNSASFSTYTALLPSKNLNGVVSALNGLGIGYFNTYTELGSTYIGTYNQNYVFGDLNIFSTTAAPTQGINTSFVIGTGFVGSLYTLSADSSGNAFVGGATLTYNGNAIHNLAKLNSVGTLNAAFNANALVAINSGEVVQSVGLQSDGKIILGCSSAPPFLRRLNTDGTDDATFVTGSNFDFWDYTIFLQANGQIVAGGLFTSYNGNSCIGLARINSDGSFDATLNVGTGFFDSNTGSTGVQVVYEQSDGKILVGGTFDSYNGSPAHGIIRLNSDGTIDGTFTVGTGFNTISDFIYAIIVQTDGKILVGGTFTSYNGTGANNIIRLNSDGTVDGTFVYGTGFNNSVESIQIQTNGQILVGGAFTLYNGVSYLRIIRLNVNGSVDTAWSIGGFNDNVTAMSIYNNTVYCIGDFNLFNGTPQNRISNLYI